MKNIFEDYYLGYDMGTDSVGWAVTTQDYKVKRFKGNAMWGVRLFDESNTAQERRSFRSATRRLSRKVQRIAWLQMLFDREISKVDKTFFIRLKESNLYKEDKSTDTPYAVFADSDYTDVDFHKNYKTIYHLRKELIESKETNDVRLVYLAIHHIIKHRGHFLFDNLGEDIESINSFEKLYEDLALTLKENFEIEQLCTDVEQFSEILKDKHFSKTGKASALMKLCGITKKSNPQTAAILTVISGGTAKLTDLFNDDSYDEGEIKSITFSGNFDEKESDYIALLDYKYELIEKLKAIYDWAILADILNGEKYISNAKVKCYETHKDDLKQLKTFVKENCPEKYYKIFRESKKGLKNYTAYSGKIKVKGQNGVLLETAVQEDFCKFLNSELKEYKNVEGYSEMFSRIENSTFMPKQITKDNGVIPRQLNRQELKIILNNASEYLGFLNETDENNISIKDKILKIFDFRIPYYVGPLNTHSDKHWLVRTDEKIYPWNFEKVVDIEKSAENFITNLTSKCTYLRDKDVIPKCSILFSKYMVLNELNNLRVNGNKIDVKLKQDIFNNLFLNRKKVTLKAVREYMKPVYGDNFEITGIDKDFKSSMSSYIELSKYDLNEREMEDIITAITIFGDDKTLLKKRLNKKFKDKLSESEIKKISQLKFKDWGAFSREFLTEIYDFSTETGEVKGNIIDTLWNTNDNLMELLGSKYNFRVSVENAMRGVGTGQSLKEMVDNLYIPPNVKRPVYQTLKIANEITKIMGHTPKKIFVEMTRHDGVKGEKGRKLSRKTQLADFYESCKEDSKSIYNEFAEKSDDEFKRDKLYLYFTQFGKCMYTGKRINIDDLFNNNIYDIDHIYPRSKVKDDSLDNRVLVKKTANAKKTDEYPINVLIQDKMRSHWAFLLSKGLISKKKYERLTRKTALTDDELSDFIARQIVETGQSTKAVTSLFKILYPETEIVYVKASTVSDFRHKYDFIKCRSVNDLHHAKDAYLNIVVGNVYNERYTHNKANFIKGLQTNGPKGISLNRMFDYNVKNAWIADNNTSISLVKKTMGKNNIIVTRYASIKSGELFDLNPVKKGNGQVSLKENSPLSNISKYGGYKKTSACYFAFVKYKGKKDKEIRQLIPIDSYRRSIYESNPIKYLTKFVHLNSPEVLIPVVKYNSCIEIDGFRMNISSKSSGGKQIAYKPAVQPVIGDSFDRYVKKIEKLLEKPENYVITEYDGITSEMNLELYKELIYKLTSTVFSVKFSDWGEKMKNALEVYQELPLRKQCYVISEILKILHNNVLSGDLTDIGESKKSGTTTTNSALSEIKNVSKIYLVNQSVTGLFETKIDLLNM